MKLFLDRYLLYHLAGIFFLLCCSFFFSCTETTLFSLSSYQVKKIQQKRPKSGALIGRLIANPRRLLISILVGNMFVNIFASLLGDSLLRHIIPGAEGTLLAIIIMTFAVLVMGEVTPKIIAIQWNERIAPFVAPVINAVGTAIYPIRRIVRLISDKIISLFSGAIVPGEHAITEEEIKTAIEIGSRDGVVDKQEREMIKGVFEFADRRVASLMRPRQEIVAFDINTPLEEIEHTIRIGELSRIPIYRNTLDSIIGILYAKDLLGATGAETPPDIKKLLRPAFFVPESKTASALLREFRRRKIHLAIVVDEYGGVSGLITLEDLLEEIVGEIRDKGDAAPLFQKLDPTRYRIKARMEIGDFNELLGAGITDPASATIGGFLVSRIGKIPPAGYQYRYGNLLFTIASAAGNRIREIIVSREGL